MTEPPDPIAPAEAAAPPPPTRRAPPQPRPPRRSPTLDSATQAIVGTGVAVAVLALIGELRRRMEPRLDRRAPHRRRPGRRRRGVSHRVRNEGVRRAGRAPRPRPRGGHLRRRHGRPVLGREALRPRRPRRLRRDRRRARHVPADGRGSRALPRGHRSLVRHARRAVDERDGRRSSDAARRRSARSSSSSAGWPT